MKININFKRQININKHLYKYLKQRKLLKDFIDTITIDVNNKKEYTLESIILTSQSSIKWLEVYNDYNKIKHHD